MREVYGWGTPNFRGNLLIGNIGRVVEYIAADAAIRSMPRAAEEQLARRPVPEADLDPAAQLFVSLDKGLGDAAFDAGLTLYPLRPSAPGAADGGIGLSPYVFGTTETTLPAVRQPVARVVRIRGAGERHRRVAPRRQGSQSS